MKNIMFGIGVLAIISGLCGFISKITIPFGLVLVLCAAAIESDENSRIGVS